AERNPYPCRRCGKKIYWHRAQSGKHYPCDDAQDRRSFHKCEPAQQSLVNSVDQQPAPNPKPLTPDYFDLEPSVEERLDHLDQQLASLVRTVKSIEAPQPITSEDVGF